MSTHQRLRIEEPVETRMISTAPVQMLISQRCHRTQDLQSHGRDTHGPDFKTPCRTPESSPHGERSLPSLRIYRVAAREHLFFVADICLEEFVAKKLVAGFSWLPDFLGALLFERVYSHFSHLILRNQSLSYRTLIISYILWSIDISYMIYLVEH